MHVGGIVAFLLRIAFSAPRSGPTHRSGRVLILEPFGLGDALSLLSLVKALESSGWSVTLCSKAPWRPLFPETVHWIEASAPWASYSGAEKYALLKWCRRRVCSWLAELREVGWNAVGIDPRGDVRSVAALWIAGCRTVLTLSHYHGTDAALFPGTAERVPIDMRLRKYETNETFGKLLGADVASGWRVDLRARLGLVRNEKSCDVVVLPASPWPGREWSHASWADLIRRFRETGISVRVITGPGQAHAYSEIRRGGVLVVECASVCELAAEMNEGRIAIVLDSGPMHLADALQIPLVALFNFGIVPMWAPSGEFATVLHRLHDADYFPAHQTDAEIDRGRKLMARHSVDSVYKEAMLLLDRVQNRAS